MNTKTVFLISVIGTAVSTSAVVFNPANGHSYDEIPGAKTWSDAKTAAEALGGYLATITSANENSFITAAFPSAVSLGFWLGGFQPVGAGPEPDGGWEWVTGEPFAYTNWAAGEPNDNGAGEGFMQFDVFGTKGGTWNDLPDILDPLISDGFVVEFDAAPAVLDGGATIGLLGIGVAALCAVRRKVSR